MDHSLSDIRSRFLTFRSPGDIQQRLSRHPLSWCVRVLAKGSSRAALEDYRGGLVLAGPGNGLGGASSRTGCPVGVEVARREYPPRTGGDLWVRGLAH